MINSKEIKKEFPFFTNNPDIIYLDSGATSHKPLSVINSINEFYSKFNSNHGRSSYKLASILDKKIINSREIVKNFIKSNLSSEIIFTSGATDSFNKISQLIGLNFLQNNDEILYSEDDHTSFVSPWFSIKESLKRFNIEIKLIPFKTRLTGGIDIEDIKSKINFKTKIINITHIHNVFGTDSDIEEIAKLKSDYNFLLNIDGTQAVGHIPVNVQDLKCDFYSFSGHKMFASQGIGVLYVNQNLLNNIKIVFLDIKAENLDLYSQNNLSEFGTQNYAGIISLSEAINFIQNIGEENIHEYLSFLTQYLLSKLRTLNNIEFTKGPNFWKCAGGNGIISFNHKDINSAEIGFILDQNNINVRTGIHCSTNNLNDSVRISMHIYNTKEEIDKLFEVLKLIFK